MKRVYLQKDVQRGKAFYIGKGDPRDLVRLAGEIEVSTPQEAQRPLNGNRVKAISDYVASNAEEGMLPTSLVLGTKKKDKLCVNQASVVDEKTGETIALYYMDIPVTDQEFAEYADTIDVMDGQHRLFSFKEIYCQLERELPYEIPFSLYICPTLLERRQIFKITNEKQEKVSANLLMWFREKLGMLTNRERMYHPLVLFLNTENCSPLKSRIIMGSERISKGYKAQQLIGILHKAKINDLSVNGSPFTVEQQLQIICTYLEGWEEFFGCKFTDPKKEDGPATKISGLRYMILLLPTFWKVATDLKRKFDQEFVVEILGKFPEILELAEGETVFTNEDYLNAFRGEGATVTMAESHGKLLALQIERERDAVPFNPLA